MRGSLPAAPLGRKIAQRLVPGYGMADFVRDWVDRFPDNRPEAIHRFVARALAGESDTVTRDRADEALIVLGVLPVTVWGDLWWD